MILICTRPQMAARNCRIATVIYIFVCAALSQMMVLDWIQSMRSFSVSQAVSEYVAVGFLFVSVLAFVVEFSLLEKDLRATDTASEEQQPILS